MDASGDPPSGGKAPRRPACDNCKERKTRCDRLTPCSYCKASGLDCRLTKTNSTERRQRILISAKYDEAIESINHQLGQVLGMIQSLDLNKSQRNSSSPDSYDASYSLPHGSSDEASQCPLSLSYGFQGEPSFMAHLGSITDTLGAIASNPAVEGRLGESGSQWITRQLHERVLSDSLSTSGGDSLPLPLHAQHPELKSCQLPAPEMILKIVRFAQIKRQRFFADAAVIDEHEFYELCQQVCFPISLYSFSAWIVVNVGLYYLLIDMKKQEYSHLGLDTAYVESNAKLLASNIETACRCIRACTDHTERDCQAISLLVTFSLKRGHTARGWKLNCTAARACLDLGMHRLPPGSHDPDTARKKKIFWSIYFAHVAMACTFGRPSSMPLHEITTDRLARPYDLPGMPGKIYSTGFDYSILMAEVHLQLFSAPAKDMPKHVRIKLARKFAGRVAEIHSDLLRSDDGDGSFPEAATLFDILLDSLATIVWQLIPPDDPSSCLGQYHPSCVEAARRMLSSIQRFGTILNSVSFRGWSNFVNILLCYTPFTAFLVLITNSTITRSTSDLALLSSVLNLLESVAADSPFTNTIYKACLKLYQIAESLVSGAYQQAQIQEQPHSVSSLSDESLIQDITGDVPGMAVFSQELGFLPAQQDFVPVQDWNTFVNSFGGDPGGDTTMFPGPPGVR